MVKGRIRRCDHRNRPPKLTKSDALWSTRPRLDRRLDSTIWWEYKRACVRVIRCTCACASSLRLTALTAFTERSDVESEAKLANHDCSDADHTWTTALDRHRHGDYIRKHWINCCPSNAVTLLHRWYSLKKSPATMLYKVNRSLFCRPVMPQRLAHASMPCKLVREHTSNANPTNPRIRFLPNRMAIALPVCAVFARHHVTGHLNADIHMKCTPSRACRLLLAQVEQPMLFSILHFRLWSAIWKVVCRDVLYTTNDTLHFARVVRLQALCPSVDSFI